MLEFKQSDTAIALILTLSELVTLAAPNFLFIFTHVLTKDQVKFIKIDGDDESTHPDRYNQYTVNPSALFAGKQSGEWHYTIYEQASDTNLDPTLATGAVEYGKLMLDRAAEFEYDKYDSPTTYKSYNG